MNILILGGCFLFQDFIEEGRLYHETLFKKLLPQFKEVKVVPLRYERIKNTLSKIEKKQKEGKIDYLVFHLKAEPFMRITKFWYRFEKPNGSKAFSFHLGKLTSLFSEIFDIPIPDKKIIRTFEYKKENAVYHFCREVNYKLGYWLGNHLEAFQIYSDFILQLKAFSIENSIELLIIGPVSRPFSMFENQISQKIENHFNLLAKNENLNYIPLIGTETFEGKSMFFPNEIHVSQ